MSRFWIIALAGLALACGSEQSVTKVVVVAPASAPAAQLSPEQTVTLREGVLQSIGRIRGKPATEAPALRTIAQAVADEAAAGKLKWQEVLPALKARVKAARPIRGAFGVGATKVQDAKNVDPGQFKHALDPQKPVLGLGVAAGSPMGESVRQHIVVYIAAEALRTFGNDAADACIGAGHPVSGGAGDPVCCAGLRPIGCARVNDDGTCPVCKGRPICAACGNGQCGNGENACNCPADCAKPAGG